MKPLHENYRSFVLLCICPPTESISYWMKLFNVLILISCILFESTTTIASVVFIGKYFSINLPNALCACYQVATGCMALYTLITAHINRKDLKEIFDAFQAFYDASKIII